MKKHLALVMAIAGLAGASVACAADSSDRGFYVFGGVGQTLGDNGKSAMDSLLTSAGGIGFSSNYSRSTVFKLDVGYQLNKNFGVEGGYVGSNHETYNAIGGNLAGPLAVSAGIKGWNLTGVLTEPIGKKFSFLAKVGIADFKVSGSLTGPGGTASASGSKSDITFGAGLKYDFTPALFGRMDVDRYTVGSSSANGNVVVWMFDLGYKF